MPSTATGASSCNKDKKELEDELSFLLSCLKVFPADTVCNIYFFHEVATKGGKFERMNWLLTQYVEQHKAGEHLHSDNAPSSSQVFKWILGFENMF